MSVLTNGMPGMIIAATVRARSWRRLLDPSVFGFCFVAAAYADTPAALRTAENKDVAGAVKWLIDALH